MSGRLSGSIEAFDDSVEFGQRRERLAVVCGRARNATAHAELDVLRLLVLCDAAAHA